MRGRGLASLALAALAAGCLNTPDAAGAADAAGAPDGGRYESSLTDGLVGWYQMDLAIDGGDGTTVIAPDTTGGGDGLCVEPACPALAPGHIGMAYEYDGIDDEVLVEDRASFHSDEGTVAVWIYLTGTGTMLISKPYGDQDGNSWLLYADSDGSILFETAGLRSISPTDLVSIDRWIHVAMTWSADANLLYIDGKLIRSGGNGTVFDGNQVILGSDHDFGDQILPMQGMLDDVRIYDRVLTPDEITALAAM